MFFGGVPLAFGLIHFFAFVFFPKSRENLHYAIFTVSIAAFIFANFYGRFLVDAPFQKAVEVYGRSSTEIALTLIIWRFAVIATVLSA
jgi:hypothetical protein